jgi:hypothetical protein
MIFEVDRTNIRSTRTTGLAVADLEPGQVRMQIERCAFTANNISYAFAGDLLGYWDFFPADAPWGRIPTMGLATVAESANPDIAEGGRYFGFYPMATEVIIDAKAKSSGFSDVGPHREKHAVVYTDFLETTMDSAFTDERADAYLLLRGLFMTSFLVEDFLDDNNFFGAAQTLVTSASSKTSIALAHCLKLRGHHSIGLTSPGNVEFVQATGLYDEVITYDALEDLDAATPSAVVDMAGNSQLTGRIHRHFADNLGHSCTVGATHWEEAGGNTGDMPGPEPTFFFAPAQMEKRSTDWGPGEMTKRINAALGVFLDESTNWMSIAHSAGADAVEAVYQATVTGSADPSQGNILAMNPAAFGGDA